MRMTVQRCTKFANGMRTAQSAIYLKYVIRLKVVYHFVSVMSEVMELMYVSKSYTMAVSRGENYNKIKNSKISTVFGGEYLEIGTVFRIVRDMRSALYEVRACQDTKWCQDCDLSHICKLSSRYVPECSAFKRDDNVEVYFNRIY